MLHKIKEKFTTNKYFYIFLSLFMLIGIGLRIYIYTQQYSFNIDEAPFAKSILGNNMYCVPTTFAPSGILIFSKLLVNIFGNNELTFRAIPLVSGLGSIFLFYFFAKKYLSPQALLFAVLLFSVSPKIIQYSNFLKQYSSDIFVTLILFLAADHFFNKEKIKILIPAILGIYYGFSYLIKNQKTNFFKIILISCVWLIFSIINFHFLNKYGPEPAYSAFLMDYWKDFFMPIPLNLTWMLINLCAIGVNIFMSKANTGIILGSLIITGTVLLAIKEKEKSLLLFLPIIITLIASGLKLIPFADRMILFLAPIFIILIAKSFGILNNLNLKPIIKNILFIAFSLIILTQIPLKLDVMQFRTSDKMNSIFDFLKQNINTNDYIYARYWDSNSINYYNDYKYNFSKNIYNQNRYLGNRKFNHKLPLNDKIDFFKYDINDLKNKSKRVWFIFYSHCFPDEINFFKNYLSHEARLIKSKVTNQGEVYLYEFNDASIDKKGEKNDKKRKSMEIRQ